MRIGLDLDGTVYWWTKAAIEMANRLHGKLLLDPTTEVEHWDYLEKTYGIELFDQLWKTPYVEEMFARTRPFFGATRFVEMLHKDHDVRVITSRPERVRATTIRRWLADFGHICVPSFFFAPSFFSKKELKCDIYIDDHPLSGRLKGDVILIDRPYNQETKGVTRAFDYLGVMNAIAERERNG